MLNKKRTNHNKTKKSKSFLLRLFDILNDKKYNEIIHWNSQGTSIIIQDVKKFSDIVLPNYYIHNNYKSFIRQLNLYGFSKKKDLINEGEEFQHEKFCKNIQKEQINKIMMKSRQKKKFANYIKKNDKDVKEDNILSNNNGNNDINILLNKNENDIKNLSTLRHQVEELKTSNNNLKDQLSIIKNIFNGQSIILSKIINNKNKTKINNNQNKNKKINNIKDLFKQYLYNLHIYSPYLI
jgi:hypothetical protein